MNHGMTAKIKLRFTTPIKQMDLGGISDPKECLLQAYGVIDLELPNIGFANRGG
jgi:hypothetical protein